LVCVGCSLVLWNRVQYLGVKGGLGVGGGDVFWVGVWVVWFWWVEEEFSNTLRGN